MQKLIPPYLFLSCIIFMILANQFHPISQVIPSPFNYFGILLILGGFGMTKHIKKVFAMEETIIHTFGKPSRLVTHGLFKISRNPVYLGFTLSLVGVWILLGSSSPIIGVLIFFLAANFWYIPHEEEKLEALFGKEYLAYKAKVRRWF